MEDMRERLMGKVEVRVRAAELTEEALTQLKDLFSQNPGNCRTRVTVEDPGRFIAELSVSRAWQVKATPKLVDGVRSLFGRPESLVLTP